MVSMGPRFGEWGWDGVGCRWGALSPLLPSSRPASHTHEPFLSSGDPMVPSSAAQPQLPLPNLRLGGMGGEGGWTPCPTAGLVYTCNNSPALHGCVVRLAAKGRPSAAAFCLSAVT